MSQYYNAANGTLHQFPDDATPQEIDAATNTFGPSPAIKSARVYSPDDFRAAIAKAHAAGDQDAVNELTAALNEQSAAPSNQPQYSQQQLSDGFWRATFAGDKDAAQQIGQHMQSQGINLLGPSDKNSIPKHAEPMSQAAALPTAIYHHLGNAPVGLGQLLMHGANAGMSFLPSNPASQWMQGATNSVDQAVANRENLYQSATPNGAAANIGATIGEVAPWMTGFGEARAAGLLPTIAKAAPDATMGAKLLNLGQRAGLSAGEGATMAATAPVTGQSDYGAQKRNQLVLGAGIGAGLPLTISGLGALGTGLRNAYQFAFNPGAAADQSVVRALGNNPDVLDALSGRSNVPGVQPTVAEALQTPKAIQAERKLRNTDGVPFADADNANDAARMAVLERLAGTDTQMNAAHNARTAATQPFIDANLSPGPQINAQPVLDAIKSQLSSGAGQGGKVRPALQSLQNQIASQLDGDGTISAGVLDGIRQRFRSLLPVDASAKERYDFGQIESPIRGTLESAIPGFRDYMSAYAQHSEPINTMESVRTLLQNAARQSPNSAGDTTVTLANIRRALRLDDRAKYPMSDEARQQLEDVLGSLRDRSAANSRIGASGSNTAADTAQLARPNSEVLSYGLGTLGALAGHFSGIPVAGELGGYALGRASSRLYDLAQNRVQSAIAQRWADANAAADAIRRATPVPSGLSALVGRKLPNLFPISSLSAPRPSP